MWKGKIETPETKSDFFIQVKSIVIGAQYLTPNNKMYCEKVCWFSSGNWFLSTKFVQLAVAGEWRTIVDLQKRA
jgi:hypothetical protein